MVVANKFAVRAVAAENWDDQIINSEKFSVGARASFPVLRGSGMAAYHIMYNNK